VRRRDDLSKPLMWALLRDRYFQGPAVSQQEFDRQLIKLKETELDPILIAHPFVGTTPWPALGPMGEAMARYSQATGVDTFSGGSGDGQGSLAGGPGDDSIEGDAAMDAAAFFSKLVDFYFRLTPGAQDGVLLAKVSDRSINNDGIMHLWLAEAPRFSGASTGSADPTRTRLAGAFGHMAVAPTKVLPPDLDSNIDNKICKESERSAWPGSARWPHLATSCLTGCGAYPRRRLGGTQGACGGYLKPRPHDAILRFADVKNSLIVVLGVTTESVPARAR